MWNIKITVYYWENIQGTYSSSDETIMSYLIGISQLLDDFSHPVCVFD